MYRNPTTGTATLAVGAGSAAVLAGEVDVSTWDDEELAYGRKRDKNGNFTGKPPRLIPVQCWSELKRRQAFDANSTMGKRIAKAAGYLADVAEGKVEPSMGRMRACESLLDRVLGKPVDRIQMDTKVDMSVSIEEAPWAVALRNAVRSGAIPAASTPSTDDIVDAEIVEDDPLCLCGCGQPPAEGSAYFNAKHERRAQAKTRPAHNEPPSEDELRLWRRHHGATPPPTNAAGQFIGVPVDADPVLEDDDDPVLTDDEDDFIEE